MPNAKIRRGVGLERVALARCTSEEARKALENYFARNLEIGQAAGVKAAITRRLGEREDLDHTKSIQARD